MPATVRILKAPAFLRTGFAGLSAAILSLLAANPVASQDQPARPRPVEDALSYADLLYEKKQFALAAQQYLAFIRERPDSPNLQVAWFRLGECYLEVKQTEDAVKTFNYLVSHYKRGSFVGASAYRLAVMRFNEKDYRNALAYFKIAKDELSEPAAKVQAQFYYARSLQLTGQAKEALAHYEAVMAAQPAADNPIHERCLLESARLLFELGDTAKSLERFQALATGASTPEFREEAIVRGGLMAAEAGQPDLSEQLLSEALKFPDTSPWKSLAQTGAIFNAYTRSDHERVVALYNTGAHMGGNAAQDESRTRMLLVVGHSFRVRGDNESALRLYSLVEGKSPGKPEGTEAGYRKLQILYQQGDPGLPAAAKAFVERQTKVDKENPFIDMAWLMAGEWHFAQAESSASGPGSEFAKKHHLEAAAAYRKVRPGKIEKNYLESLLYKQGWAEIESGDVRAGIATLARFVQQHPDSTFASSALAKRAMAYQSQGDHQFALGDYLDIAKRHPNAPELEFALQQTALIYAHLRKTPEMIEAYKNLLAKFPKTEGVGEAHYWIGVGNFDLRQYAEAVAELAKARELDPSLADKATLRLVISHYQLDDIPKLTAEAKRYLDSAPTPEATKGEAPPKRAAIPPRILEDLGRKLADDGEWEDAERFLSAIADPAKAEQTSAAVWRLLGDSRAKLKKHDGAVLAYDQFLLQTDRPSDRASAYLARGLAQFCLRDFDAARASAQESLRSQKEGRTNAETRLLLGDIAAAGGDLEAAVKEYLVVSQIFMDPEITPRALTKAINAYRSLGNQAKAQELTQELSAGYPNYTAPASLDHEC